MKVSEYSKEAFLIGAVVGVVHSLSETILLTAFGVRLPPLDPLLIALVVGAAAVLVSISISLSFVALRRACRREDTANAGFPRRLVVAVLLLFYGGRTVAVGYPFGEASKWILLGLFLSGLVAVWIMTRRHLDSFDLLSAVAATAVFSSILVTGLLREDVNGLFDSAVTGFAPAGSLAVILGTLIFLIFTTAYLRRRPRMVFGRGRTLAVLGVLLVVGIGVNRVWPSLHMSTTPQSLSASVSDPGERPNVILIVLDTLASGHMDLFGYDDSTMPRLSRFAEENLDVVAKTHAPSPWTPPTHASIFTGTWSFVHGCHRPSPGGSMPRSYCLRMRDDLPTLAEWLGRQGYSTGAVVANHAVLRGYGLPRGFRDFDARPGDAWFCDALSWVRIAAYRTRWIRSQLRRLPDLIRTRTVIFDPYAHRWRGAQEINGAVRRWLRSRATDPYFLFINYLDPHSPYTPQTASSKLRDLPLEWLEHANRIWERAHERNESPPDDLVLQLARLYDMALRDLDEHLVDLLEYLRSRTDWERTLLIITSDHGEEFMEHGHLEHSTNVYEAQISTPILVRLPRPRPPVPSRLPDQFQQVDLFATIASVIGGPQPETDGRPWGVGRDYALSEVFANPELSPRYATGYCAVIIDGHKYVRSSDGSEELFDLGADPEEQTNLVEQRQGILERARRIADRRDEGLAVTPVRPSEVDPAETERLKSIGYVE